MKRRIVVVLQDAAQAGAVATSCHHQLASLAGQHSCTLITNGLLPVPAGWWPVMRVPVPSLSWMRLHAQVPRQMVFILMAGIALLRTCRRGEIALVLFHSHPPAALLSPVLRFLLGCRVAMVMHGDIHDRPRGTYDPRLTWWYRICTTPAYRRLDAVLALSPYMADLAIKGGANPHQVYLAPNGVDAEEIGLAQPASPPRGQRLLFVGRMEYNKGVDLLVQAFSQLAPHYPGLSLTCIGHSDVRYLAPLKRQLLAMDLAERVTFLPPQSRHELGKFYTDAALVVVPSRSETQSTVAMEAMAAGRAVLASDTGGNPMLVDSPSTGLLFRTGDRADLALQLERLIASPSTLVSMGRAAQLRHRACLTLQRRSQVFLACIDRIVAGLGCDDSRETAL